MDKESEDKRKELLEEIDKRNKNVLKNAPHNQGKKYVGKTFMEVFGDLIAKLIKYAIIIGIIYLLIKYDTFSKLKEIWELDNTVDKENYIVEDEYLKELNSKRGKKGDVYKF